MAKKKIILTGDRPTGPLHLGHYVGSLQNRVKLQNEYEQFILIADMQALTDNAAHPEKLYQNIIEVTLDYLAVGIDPTINTICIQSQIPAISELTMYYLNLVTTARLERNPTVKEEIKQKEFGSSIPAGFLTYPVSQAADITAFKANLVPVGKDQLPMIEQTNEIVRKFNGLYDSVLVETKALIPETGHRLPGTDGKAKMSKSLGNAIFLSDPENVIQKKVMGMYTDPNHLKVKDPGKIEGNPVFDYLNIFDQDKKSLEKMKAHYKKGGLGDVIVKKHLNEILQNLLKPIRTRRAEFAKNKDHILKILKEGTAKAREKTEKTLDDVKKAMKIDYFK